MQEDFRQADGAFNFRADFPALLSHEYSIFRQFQRLEYTMYKQYRLAYLEHILQQQDDISAANLQILIGYLQQFRPRIAVYAGSFNPFHLGHLNIVQKAEKIFDKVIIARGQNPEKPASVQGWNIPALAGYQTSLFSGLLTEYLKEQSTYADITLVKGLRNGDDLDYEVNQLRFMEGMYPDLKVVFLQCDKEFEHISSTALRNLELIQPGLSHPYLP